MTFLSYTYVIALEFSVFLVNIEDVLARSGYFYTKGTLLTYNGTYWSEIIRSLLSLRRDKDLSEAQDKNILQMLAKIETRQSSPTELQAMLEDLCPARYFTPIGQSILSYIDFNKLGNLYYLLSVSENISQALAIMKEHCSEIFEQPCQFLQTTNNHDVIIHISLAAFTIRSQLTLVIILALMRHIAGRNFDFTRVAIPADVDLIISAVSQLEPQRSSSFCLEFNCQWLTTPSFFYSPQIQQVLQKSLLLQAVSTTFKQQLSGVFSTFPAPAKIRAELVAEKLAMSLSSFRRQLRDEDISFSLLLKEYIHEGATRLLLQGEKVDDVAGALGFSDRRAFDRSYKDYTGIKPGQLRQLSSRMKFQKGNQNLISIIEHLPPLPDTISNIINADYDSLTLTKITQLITPDPVFHALIMGKASRALYGTPPTTLEQAIARNLGIENVKNLAIVFAAQQFLTVQSKFTNITQLTDAMLLSKTLYDRVFETANESEETQLISQMLLFGPLSLLLMFHQQNILADGILKIWNETKGFKEFTQGLQHEFGLCLYGASSLLLVKWGFTNKLNLALWRLCQNEELNSKVASQISLCHELAFDYLCHNKMPCAEALARLSIKQAANIETTLNKW
jgi:AraC-like DNA-binding protein/HD-like signal output (HDOD) protein